jgi:two-component system, OmpR family, response regulator
VNWQLPDGSGLQWVKSARDRGDGTPALMLTARDQLADRVAGLDTGLDDYLVKPFAVEELAARLRAVSRRTAAPSTGQCVVGDVHIDLTARSAHVGGALAVLTAREWAVLEALTLRAGRIVSRSDLERLITGFESELASNAVEVHISALRRKLGREVIQTVRGLGYRLGASDSPTRFGAFDATALDPPFDRLGAAVHGGGVYGRVDGRAARAQRVVRRNAGERSGVDGTGFCR